MTAILAFLKSLPLKEYVYGGIVVAVLGGGAWFVQYERSQGAQAEQLKTVTAEHQAALKAAQDSTAAFAHAVQDALSARQAALTQVNKAKAVEAATAQAARAAGAERDAATRLLADSLANLQQLQAEVERLVVSTRADSTAAAGQRAADQRAIVALVRAIDGFDSLNTRGKLVHHDGYQDAIARGTAAQTALTARATSAEKMSDLLKGQQSGFLARHLNVSVGYGAALSGGKVVAGPAVLAGWRVF
jgi:hypothetical protein